jgi:prepilin-type N-terminal cleavage/methylation domain-containing protein
MKNQKGFSLVELLVVVIIIAIIAAIAIPSLLASRRAANESSAANNMRTINSAQQTYFSLNANTYGAYADLVGDRLIDTAFSDGVLRSSYTYPAIALNGTATGYCATATTTDTASKSYAVSHGNVVYYLGGTAAPQCDTTTGESSDGIVLGNTPAAPAGPAGPAGP